MRKSVELSFSFDRVRFFVCLNSLVHQCCIIYITFNIGLHIFSVSFVLRESSFVSYFVLCVFRYLTESINDYYAIGHNQRFQKNVPNITKFNSLSLHLRFLKRTQTHTHTHAYRDIHRNQIHMVNHHWFVSARRNVNDCDSHKHVCGWLVCVQYLDIPKKSWRKKLRLRHIKSSRRTNSPPQNHT